MEKRRLGRSELDVSRLSLGSWRTFERLAILKVLRDEGYIAGFGTEGSDAKAALEALVTLVDGDFQDGR